MHEQLVPAVLQVQCHGRAHHAESDESDLCHVLCSLFIRVGAQQCNGCGDGDKALCAMRYALGDRGRRVAGGSAAERLHLIRRSARMFARIEVSHVCHLSEPPALAYRTIFR
jgi:hypothetical protein